MSAEQAGGSRKVPRRNMLQAMGAASAAALVPGVAAETGIGDTRTATVPYSALSVRGLAAPSAQAQPLFADVYHLICGEDREKWPTLSCSAADQTVQLRTSLGAVTILTGTAPAERLRITPEGNIGIGTASPTAKLHVAGSFSASGPLDINLNNMLGARPAAAFFTAATEPFAPQGRRMGKNAIGWFRDPQSGQPESEATLWLSGDQGMTFFTQSSPRLRITPEGNVGIGTTEPSESLHVAGNIQLDGMLNVRGEGSEVEIFDPAASGARFHFSGHVLSLAGVNDPEAFGPHLPYIAWRQADNSNAMYLGWGNTDAKIVDLGLENEFMLSVTGGNVHFADSVGIGTLEPSASLHVVGDAQVDGRLYSQGGVEIFNPDPAGARFIIDSHALSMRGVNDPVAYSPRLPYIEWRQADETRAMYLGWGDTNSKYVDLALENGFNLAINGGMVGIGAHFPSFSLDVRGANGWIGSGDSSQTVGGWRLGRWPDYEANTWVYLVRADSTAYQDLAVGALYAGGDYKFGTADDLAEITPLNEADNLEAGDVVVIEHPADNSVLLGKSREPYDHRVAGVVSDAETAGLIIGGHDPAEVAAKSVKPIALAGRVLTKVCLENGRILPGDPLASSSLPGYAMKATKPGYTIGKALQAFESSSTGEATGKIWMLVNLNWFGGEIV